LITTLAFPEKPHRFGPSNIIADNGNADYMRNSRVLTKRARLQVVSLEPGSSESSFGYPSQRKLTLEPQATVYEI
jgi:hypothetical protein